jgi:hypothetical protein
MTWPFRITIWRNPGDPMKRKQRISLLAAVVAALLAALAALTTSSASAATTWTVLPASQTKVITPDGKDQYDVEQSGSTYAMRAPGASDYVYPANTGTNLREVYWPAGTANTTNSQVCAKWYSQTDQRNQEGLAFHVVNYADGHMTGITVTKGVIYGVSWVFNVHTWDTSGGNYGAPAPIAQFDMGSVVTANGTFKPFPWSICGRLVNNQLQVKVWVPADEVEPAWTDTTHVGTVAIPAAFQSPGKSGFYIGHLWPGDTALYTNAVITNLDGAAKVK